METGWESVLFTCWKSWKINRPTSRRLVVLRGWSVRETCGGNYKSVRVGLPTVEFVNKLLKHHSPLHSSFVSSSSRASILLVILLYNKCSSALELHCE